MPTTDQITDAAYQLGYTIGYYGWPFFLLALVVGLVATGYLLTRHR